jgi:hypothetical protein
MALTGPETDDRRSGSVAVGPVADAPPKDSETLVSSEDAARLPDGIDDAYPASMLQAGTFFHTEFSESGTAYHELFSFMVPAPFQRRSLERALSLLVARHPILRTSFDFSHFTVPMQLVHRSATIPLDIEQSSSTAAHSPEAYWQQWFKQQLQSPLVRDTAPLLRLGVCEWSPTEYQLNVLFHHALMDARSFQLFLMQLRDQYERCLRGEAVSEPVSNSAFRDFIRLERKSLTSQASRQFWSEYLAGSVPGRFRPGFLNEDEEDASSGNTRHHVHDTVPSARLLHIVPEKTTAALVALATRLGVSLRSVLLAAHARLLRDLIGTDDVLTGLIVHGRPQTAEASSSLGLFQNTLPFRMAVPPMTPWPALVHQASASELALLQHSQLPLAIIQRDLGGPAFQAIFAYAENDVDPGGDHDAIKVNEIASYGEIGVPLAVTFVHEPSVDRLQLRLVYDRVRIPRDRIVATARRYAALLETLAGI